MVTRLAGVTVLSALMVGAAACHTVENGGPRPAVLIADTPEARDAIKTVVLSATRDGQVSFAGSDLAREPVIVVQPPPPGPLEGNSPALPVYFDLMTNGKECFARERRTGTLHPLPGVACRAR
jgi:hypothetical protein